MALAKTKVRLGVPKHELSNGEVVTGLTSAGTTQADAYAITADVSVFGTVGASSGARLPDYDVDDVLFVSNGGANALALYPPVGGYVNNASVNAAYSVAAGKCAMARRVSATRWVVVCA